ncbi:MAG: hypothetical protein JWO16_1793, partial [Sphingomonas bacterium]|nr:hypothetical protein [Sphingomonas bacterium]
FLDDELSEVAPTAAGAWRVDLGDRLLFDREGLRLIAATLAAYRGSADVLTFALRLDAQTFADYYSLQGIETDAAIPLDAFARRVSAGACVGSGVAAEVLAIALPVDKTSVPFPAALTAAGDATLPRALLMPCGSPFDLLFANQIALTTDLARRVRRSPRALIAALLPRRGVARRLRCALAYRSIAADAQIHPTAVVEGSVIGPGARIGAHCVVRFSRIGAGARLHDGAKVEFSVVGARSWLMHDLVLVRSQVEDDVFLIHGPYQFSQFQSGSAAFATILMDYRADRRPIRVATAAGPRAYLGRFLGCVLESGAKTLGGSVVGPGRIVARDTWLGVEASAVHLDDAPDAPPRRCLPPQRRAPAV